MLHAMSCVTDEQVNAVWRHSAFLVLFSEPFSGFNHVGDSIFLFRRSGIIRIPVMVSRCRDLDVCVAVWVDCIVEGCVFTLYLYEVCFLFELKNTPDGQVPVWRMKVYTGLFAQARMT